MQQPVAGLFRSRCRKTDINIGTVTIVAYPGDGAIHPGIGGIGADCGRITITDA